MFRSELVDDSSTHEVDSWKPQLLVFLAEVNQVQDEIHAITTKNKRLTQKQFNADYNRFAHVADKLKRIVPIFANKPGIGPMLAEGSMHLDGALKRFEEWDDNLPKRSPKKQKRKKRITRKRKTLTKRRRTTQKRK